MRWRHIAELLGFVVVVICTVVATNTALRAYDFRRDNVRGEAELYVPGENEDSGTNWRVFTMLYVGKQYPMPFLVDSGWAGPTVVTPQVLGLDTRNKTLQQQVHEIEETDGDELSGSELENQARARGIDVHGHATRTIASLSGTFTIDTIRGATEIAFSPGGDTIARNVSIQPIPHTPCVLTFADLLRLRVSVLDFRAKKLRVGLGDAPGGTAWLRQGFSTGMGVATVDCRINGHELSLVVDTGFSGAVGLNKTVRDVVSEKPESILTEVVAQKDVQDATICAQVGMGDLELLYDKAPPCQMGKVPIFLNEATIDGADGLIGLGILKLLTPLVFDVQGVFRTPRIGTGDPRGVASDWTPELLTAQFDQTLANECSVTMH